MSGDAQRRDSLMDQSVEMKGSGNRAPHRYALEGHHRPALTPTLGIRAFVSHPRSRDSILLTYFVDAGVLRFLRNRGKRVGNFVLTKWATACPERCAFPTH
jgi:hypothetical protein